MSKETKYLHITGKKGYVVDEQTFAWAKCDALDMNGLETDWSDVIEDDFDSILVLGNFSFAILHNITLENEQSIVRALEQGVKILFQPTSEAHTLELQKMYEHFVQLGAIEVPRRAMIEDLLPILDRMFCKE